MTYSHQNPQQKLTVSPSQSQSQTLNPKLNLLNNTVDLTATEQRHPCYQLNSSTIYLPTLKCANTWASDLLAAQGYTTTSTRTAPTVLIITRDPLSRWRSAVVTYMRIHHSDKTTGSALQYTLDMLFESSLILDAHSAPQSQYVQHIPLDQILAFDIATVSTNLAKYLNISIDPHLYRNSTQQHPFMRWADQYLTGYLKRYNSELHTIYQCDYELLKRLHYYT